MPLEYIMPRLTLLGKKIALLLRTHEETVLLQILDPLISVTEPILDVNRNIMDQSIV